MEKKKKCQKKSKKNGFTLIELLAVIVVLSIIMVIAVYAIMPQVEKARKRAFAIEATGLIKSAEIFTTELALNGEGVSTTGCYVTVADLYKRGNTELKPDEDSYQGIGGNNTNYKGAYTGYVIIKLIQPSANDPVQVDRYQYELALKNKTYKVPQAIYDAVDETNVLPLSTQGSDVTAQPSGTNIPPCITPTTP